MTMTVSIGEALDEASSGHSGRFRVDAEAAVELRLGALHENQKPAAPITSRYRGCPKSLQKGEISTAPAITVMMSAPDWLQWIATHPSFSPNFVFGQHPPNASASR